MFIASLLLSGIKLYREGDHGEAKEFFKLAIQVVKMQGEKPEHRSFICCANFNLGFILQKDDGDKYSAIDAFSSASASIPSFYGATFLKAMNLFELGFVDESLALTANSPPQPPFQIVEFPAAKYLLGEQGAQRMDVVTLESVRMRLMHLNYSGRVPRDEITARHEKWGRDVRAFLGPAVQHARVGLDPEKRLRIGYISGDLHYHVVCFNIVPLLPHRDQVEKGRSRRQGWREEGRE